MRAFKSAVAKSRARLLVTCLLMWMASILSAQTQQLPPDHPAVGAPDGRSAASDLTERLRPSSASPASIPIARKNLIDEFIFGKMEKAGVPHAGLSSDEEFFRRIHIDLTGRLPQDEPLRAFLASRDPDKRDKLIDQLTSVPTVRNEVDGTSSTTSTSRHLAVSGTPRRTCSTSGSATTFTWIVRTTKSCMRC